MNDDIVNQLKICENINIHNDPERDKFVLVSKEIITTARKEIEYLTSILENPTPVPKVEFTDFCDSCSCGKADQFFESIKE